MIHVTLHCDEDRHWCFHLDYDDGSHFVSDYLYRSGAEALDAARRYTGLLPEVTEVGVSPLRAQERAPTRAY